MVLLVLANLRSALVSMPWDGWSWAVPQAPIEYFFRRHQDVLVKSPELQCQCPPHKECDVEYRINEDMPEFLKLRGLLKDKEFKELKNDVKDAHKVESKIQTKIENIRSRRQNEDLSQKCCCPPRSVMMPTFITDRKFDEVANRLQKKVLSE